MKPPRSALGLLLLAFHSAPCLAESSSNATSTSAVERCVDLHEKARIQRIQEQWQLARDAMKECAVESCPLALRVDCQDWLAELERTLPSLLVVIERAESDARAVRVELDGRELTLPEPLGPIEVLPGKHELRASVSDHAPLVVELLLEKGEKNRVVHLRFTRPQGAEPSPERPAPLSFGPPPSTPQRPVRRVT